MKRIWTLAVLFALAGIAIAPRVVVAQSGVTNEDAAVAFAVAIGSMTHAGEMMAGRNQAEGVRMGMKGTSMTFDRFDVTSISELFHDGLEVAYTRLSGLIAMASDGAGAGLTFDLELEGGPVTSLGCLLTSDTDMSHGFGSARIPMTINGVEMDVLITEEVLQPVLSAYGGS